MNEKKKQNRIFEIILYLICIGIVVFNVFNYFNQNQLKNTNKEIVKEVYSEQKITEDTILSEKYKMTLKTLYVDPLLIEVAQNYIGKEYPNILIKDKDGKTYNLNSFKKPIILEYISPSCHACIESIETFKKMKEKYKDKYQFIPLSNDNSPEMFQTFKDNGLEEVYALNDTNLLSNAEFEKEGFPFMIFLDTNLKIKLIHSGTIISDGFDGLIKIAFDK